MVGDARVGWPDAAPYDIIHVGAAADSEVVRVLISQLKEGGGLVVPEEVEGGQKLRVYRKMEGGEVKYEDLMDVVYAPLRAEVPKAEVDSVNDWLKEGEKVAEEMEELKGKIKRWYEEFKRTEGRVPGEVDRAGHADLQEWLSAFATKSKEVERRKRLQQKMKLEERNKNS